jgi:2TM domain
MSHSDRALAQSAVHTDEQLVAAAERYVQQLRAFYVHAAMFAGGMVLIFLVNLVTNLDAGIAGDWRSWWSAWALFGWGLGIAVHGTVVRLNRPSMSSSTWEQRQIDKVLAG